MNETIPFMYNSVSFVPKPFPFCFRKKTNNLLFWGQYYDSLCFNWRSSYKVCVCVCVGGGGGGGGGLGGGETL